MIQAHYLQRVMSVQRAIERASIVSKVDGKLASLESLCFRPIDGEGCLVEAPSQYWLGDPVLLAGDGNPSLTAACQTTDPFLSTRSPCMDRVSYNFLLRRPVKLFPPGFKLPACLGLSAVAALQITVFLVLPAWRLM